EDNFVSNESSYLQAAPAILEYAAPGRVYLGVGPEQNFSYIALTRPSDAFIVDIRRDNLILHLLYKAVFDLAVDRADFLALLTGRRYEPTPALAPDASIETVIERAERSLRSPALFTSIHARIRDRIERGYGILLSAADRASLEKIH